MHRRHCSPSRKRLSFSARMTLESTNSTYSRKEPSTCHSMVRNYGSSQTKTTGGETATTLCTRGKMRRGSGPGVEKEGPVVIKSPYQMMEIPSKSTRTVSSTHTGTGDGARKEHPLLTSPSARKDRCMHSIPI